MNIKERANKLLGGLPYQYLMRHRKRKAEDTFCMYMRNNLGLFLLMLILVQLVTQKS